MLDRCLVVDDHEMIRETLAIMAISIGFKESITATDGADAISKLYHQQPSFIITDLQMDPVDGLEMLRLIRSGRYGLRHDIPILIITANASESLIAQCIAFDVDAFLVKPVNKQALQERITHLLQQEKPKKSVEHYFDMYQQDPAKSTAFLVNGTTTFTDDELNEFEALIKDQKPDMPKIQQHEEKVLVHIPNENRKIFIKWQERFSVGNIELDNSNIQLLEIINDTYELIINHENNLAFEKIAQRFRDYVNVHLSFEEELLDKCNYPRLEIHQNIHQRLIKQADYILLKCQADPGFYKTDFFRLLRFWWVKHVVQEDHKYKSALLDSFPLSVDASNNTGLKYSTTQ